MDKIETIIIKSYILMADKHKIDITTGNDKGQHFKIAVSIAKTFERDVGLSYFLALSKHRNDFNEVATIELYETAVKSLSKIKFASLVYYAANAGLVRMDYLMTYGDDYEIMF